MLLYERITFILVTGTLGLFFIALVLGAWGALLTLNPGLDTKIANRVVAYVAFVRAGYARLREAYQTARRRWIPAA